MSEEGGFGRALGEVSGRDTGGKKTGVGGYQSGFSVEFGYPCVA